MTKTSFPLAELFVTKKHYIHRVVNGKTTLCATLARAMSILGQCVMIVVADADERTELQVRLHRESTKGDCSFEIPIYVGSVRRHFPEKGVHYIFDNPARMDPDSLAAFLHRLNQVEGEKPHFVFGADRPLGESIKLLR